mmetsp:Transcript_38438/g.83271  ORF Transcript_38438/g.83271 Transcript_38438/m.83271 type:complete len:80 (+) Transcript_38438:151-390(+)
MVDATLARIETPTLAFVAGRPISQQFRQMLLGRLSLLTCRNQVVDLPQMHHHMHLETEALPILIPKITAWLRPVERSRL